MRNHWNSALVLLVTCEAATSVLGCSSRHPAAAGEATLGTSAENPAGLGAVGMNLTLPGGVHISQLSYALANGSSAYSGQYSIAQTSGLSFTIGSVAAGSGYGLALTASSDDGTITCSYPPVGQPPTGNISVAERTTTVVNVNLQCVNSAGLDAGSVIVNGVTSNCPVWNTIVANPLNITLDGGANVNSAGTVGSTGILGGGTSVPASVTIGQKVVLVGGATAPDPGSLTFTWLPAGGTVSSLNGQLDPNSTDAGSTNQTVYTCPATPGTYTITMVVSDGALSDGGACDARFTTGSVSVSCLAPTVCNVGAGCGDGGQVCNAAGSCVPAQFSVVVLSSIDGGAIGTVSTNLPVSVQSYSMAGVATGSPTVLPSAGAVGSQQPVTIMGNDIEEGDLAMSADGRYLSLVGWDQTAGSGQVGAPVVARIAANGALDTSTVLYQAFSTQGAFSYRSAVSKDGNEFWVSGACNSNADGNLGGIWFIPYQATYPPAGPPPAGDQLVSLPNSTISMLNADPSVDILARNVRIFGGQLFSGSDQAPPYIFTIGSGLPVSGSQAIAPLGLPVPASGFPPSPDAFLLLNLSGTSGAPDTMYLADDGINPAGTHDNGGTGSQNTGTAGLSKWTYSAGTGWTQVWNLTAGNWGTTSLPNPSFRNMPIGFRGLAGFATGATVTLVATTGMVQGNPDSLQLFIDNGGPTAPSGPIWSVTTPSSQVFRGVALTPE